MSAIPHEHGEVADGACRARTGDPQLANSVDRSSEWVGDGQTREDKPFSPTVGASAGRG